MRGQRSKIQSAANGGPKSIPRVVQLPGGRVLSAVPFRIVERFDDGSPKTFEICPMGTNPHGDDMCALFADENWIRHANDAKASKPSSFDDIDRSVAERPLIVEMPPRHAMSDTVARGILASGDASEIDK